MRERAASHHFTYRAAHYGLGEDDPSIIEWRKDLTVTTGHDVWIGHNAIIMGGVTLGDGAVVAAGAVVTHDVAPYEIVAGVPAKHIGWRYDEETIAALMRIRWWDWSFEELKIRLKDFNDVPAFIAKYDPANK
jgi:acetyltransferase-like isoleucine patch superfamily enzyme